MKPTVLYETNEAYAAFLSSCAREHDVRCTKAVIFWDVWNRSLLAASGIFFVGPYV